MRQRRRILYATGSRAEFGLMESTLRAIAGHRELELQLVVTGMHLDTRLGYSLDQIRQQGWQVDAVVPWAPGTGKSHLAEVTGQAIAGFAQAYRQLKPAMVLVCGDRVEAFAAASAAHLAGIPLAHVHGGDRALGQVDDALRHAITKLAHLHLPATRASARRILRLGEDASRVHVVGSPGNDSIRAQAGDFATIRSQFPDLHRKRYAVLAMHPTHPDAENEYRRARRMLAVVRKSFEQVVLINPNNDPGGEGIHRCWEESASLGGVMLATNLPRPLYLGLVAESALLVGNSSSGLIEAPTLGTRVVDVGDRQKGRERPKSVVHAGEKPAELTRAIALAMRRRPARGNPYFGEGAGQRIADLLASTKLDEALLAKLITY